MIRLLLILPYSDLTEKVKRVLANHPEKDSLQADIRVMTMEENPSVATEQYDAIIARGYTARRTSAMYHNIPTIELTISGYDIVRAISECCKKYHSKKIAICGFGEQLYEAQEICSMFGTSAQVYSAPAQYKGLDSVLHQAMESGCDAVIGGTSACKLAGEYGLPSVIIRTGEDTVAQAVNEAIRVVRQLRQSRILSQMYKTIIYSSKEGILYVDTKGIIHVRNRVIREMNGDSSLMDQPLKTVMPALYKPFCNVLQSRQEEVGFMYSFPKTKLKVSVNFTPVVVNQEITGVVINFSDITQIQELEGQIRRKLSDKGLQAKYHFSDILHSSKVIDDTIEVARRYAESDSNIIIVGETGTGKELFAQSIHNCSGRKNGPFVAVNCAALPENLLESELFGYVDGAFTGTKKGGKMGLFEQAHGGTLFLDEIGEISPLIQTKLLRVLQERQVRRIGDDKVIDIDVRIISATNRSISNLVQNMDFRRDLMYRLDVLRLFLPPLRSRGDDVRLLFLEFLSRLSQKSNVPTPTLTPDALDLLQEYPFIGNIRELLNIVERAFVLHPNDTISRDDLATVLYPPDVADESEPVPHSPHSFANPYQRDNPADERERICHALECCGGKRQKAAELLGMDRSTLWRKMQKYHIV